MKRKPRPKLVTGVMSFRPSKSVHKAIKTLADRERRSVSQMIGILAEEALAARSAWRPGQD